MTTRPGDDAAVLAAFRAGDEKALAAVYARWSPLVYSLALRSLGDVGVAEEVTRRVFTEVWVARGTLDPTASGFSTWLVSRCRGCVAEARSRSVAGRAQPQGQAAAEESDDGESKPGVAAETWLVAAEMSHLDAVRQRVLRLALDDHLTHVEIAERTGLPVEEVKHHIASSLTELRHRQEVRADAH